MDPLSLTFGIASLLPLVAKAIHCAKEYRSSVLTAKDAIATLISELEALKFSLANLQQLLKSLEGEDNNLRFQHSSVLVSCSTACEVKLRSLCRKLGQAESGRRSRYLWPFSEKEHQKTLQELRNFTTWMQFALSIDGCRLLSRTADDVLKLMGQQLEHFKTTQSVQETVAQISSTVEEQKLLLEESLAQDGRNQILDWISTTKYYQKHQALQASRARNAGEWILRNPEYMRWLDGADPTDAVLWCHGIQGSGKTNLMSIIVDGLLDPTQVPPRTVAYFYFDHQDQAVQSSATVSSCILRQLLEQVSRIPKAVSGVYENSRSKRELAESECWRLIAEVTKEIGRVYVVIDAVDECATEHRASFVRTLGQLSNIQGLRMLITSRPHVREIATAFTNRIDLRIKAQEKDITAYLHHELSKNGFYDMANEEFADDLIQKLTKGADGMFLLPVLQLRTILNEPTLGEMEDSLNNIPHNLTETFEETIDRIKSLPASRSRMGMDALMYLTHATRTLSAKELCDILAVHPSRKRVNAKYRPTEKVILECCQGLVTIDATTGDVRICHYSVAEYLQQNDARLFPRAEAIFTTCCLRYILLEDFRAGPWSDKDAIVSHMERYPFLAYAARFWGRHARLAEEDGDVQAALADFFALPRAMATAGQVRQYDVGYREEYWAAEECLSLTALHHACRHGLSRTAAALLGEAGRFDVNAMSTHGGTPIIMAAGNGHPDVAGLLMQRGADPYLRNRYGNALHCAVEGNHTGTVRELISRWGMDVRGTEEEAFVYLMCALDRDSVEVFKALVELGVGFQPDAGDAAAAGEIFEEACASNCEKIAGLMIRRGWIDVNWRFGRGETVLHWAARHRSLAIIEQLVDAGADIYAMDDNGVSAWELTQQAFSSRALVYGEGAGRAHVCEHDEISF